MKARQIATPAALTLAGLALTGWSVARPVGWLPGILAGVALAAIAAVELSHRWKARQIAKRNARRRGYVR